MAFHQLSLESLKDLDGGKLRMAFNQALKRLALDLESRPTLKKARKLGLELQMLPVPDPDDVSTLDTVRFHFKMTESIPPRETNDYSAAARKGGILAFNDLSPENAKQSTIDME